MTTSTLLFLLLILACPLLMVFMHRGGGHGHGGHAHNRADSVNPAGSLDDLRRRRTELDDEIAAREDR